MSDIILAAFMIALFTTAGVILYRNPASVPGHPFIVNRKHYGEGCFLPTGGGWAQHVEQRILPQMEGFEDAGFEMYSDIRNPLGRGHGARARRAER